jgi:hypothetical protein
MTAGETIREATQDDWRAKLERVWREENEKLDPATMTAEDRRRIGAWLGHEREFKEAVALVKAYLCERGYKKHLSLSVVGGGLKSLLEVLDEIGGR